MGKTGQRSILSRAVNLIIGIPASGKSTFARSLGDVVGYDQCLTEAVEAPLVAATIERDEEGLDVLGLVLGRIRAGCTVDGVFGRREDRLRLLRRCRQLGLGVRLFWMLCPLDVAIKRNAGRAFPVPVEELYGTAANFDFPYMEEGYMDIYLVKNGDKVDAYGDTASLAGRTPDKTVSSEQWTAAGNCARIENGQVVLGKSVSQKYADDSAIIRNERYIRLRQCDKISPMRWNSMSDLQRAAWEQYRTDLLNVPQQEGFPWDGDTTKVPWPTKPE